MSDTDFRWVLRYSVLAYAVLTLHQGYVLTQSVPAMATTLASFGADLPAQTRWALRAYWWGPVCFCGVAILSAGYIHLHRSASAVALKLAYGLSLVALVATFVWSGTVLSAMQAPLDALASPL